LAFTRSKSRFGETDLTGLPRLEVVLETLLEASSMRSDESGLGAIVAVLGVISRDDIPGSAASPKKSSIPLAADAGRMNDIDMPTGLPFASWHGYEGEGIAHRGLLARRHHTT
jgi:hypothetical protein